MPVYLMLILFVYNTAQCEMTHLAHQSFLNLQAKFSLILSQASIGFEQSKSGQFWIWFSAEAPAIQRDVVNEGYFALSAL